MPIHAPPQTPSCPKKKSSTTFYNTKDHEEEDQTGNSWEHAKLPGDVYGSSPFLKSGRNKQNVVWDDVKFLKKHTVQGTTVHEKYTHACVTRITVAKSGEEGEDEDGEGNR